MCDFCCYLTHHYYYFLCIYYVDYTTYNFLIENCFHHWYQIFRLIWTITIPILINVIAIIAIQYDLLHNIYLNHEASSSISYQTKCIWWITIFHCCLPTKLDSSFLVFESIYSSMFELLIMYFTLWVIKQHYCMSTSETSENNLFRRQC